MEGVKDYFWFSKIVMQGATDVLSDPDKLVDSGKVYWLSGIFKWMVPLGGLPSPHSIVTGQWRPATTAEAKIPMGFGAITKLISGGDCGGNSRSPKAMMMKSVWQSMKKFFGLDKAKMPGSTKEFDVTGGTYEKDDCSQADAGAFPVGAFGTYPIYLIGPYMGADGKIANAKTNKCYATSMPTKFIVYQRDAYRRCAFENKK